MPREAPETMTIQLRTSNIRVRLLRVSQEHREMYGDTRDGE